MSKSQARLSLIEAFALVVVLGAVAFTMHQLRLRQHHYFSLNALDELQRTLGHYKLSERSSRNHEELIIRDYFQDQRGGTFLDVGANHYRDDNNTYYLETALGWSGLAVDALAEYAEGYAKHRPRTTYVAMFASDVMDEKARVFVPMRDKKEASISKEILGPVSKVLATEREVPTTTLNHALDAAGLTSLDFMSMDIELSEPKALAGFDVERYRPRLVCIESHLQVRQQILDYFARHGYVLIGKYLRLDPYNLYFAPLR